MAILKQVDFEVPGFGEFATPPTSVPSYPEEVMAMGPTAYWRMGEASGSTLADQVGANSLTLTGGYTLAESGALATNNDGAVRLTTGQAVSSNPAFPAGSAAAFSIIFWARTPVELTSGWIIQQSNSLLAGRLRIIHRTNSTLRFLVNGDSHFDSTQALSDNWRMVVLTRSTSGTASWYFDGQIDNQQTGQSEAIHDAALQIGLNNANAIEMVFDEIAMFDDDLSAEQIRWLYGLGTAAMVQPPSP